MIKHISLTAAILFTATNAAQSGTISLYVHKIDPGDVLPGYYTVDLLVDSDDVIRGQQLVVTLTQGSIYQDPNGNNLPTAPTPPNQAFINVFPTLEFDTFVAMGGPTSSTSMAVLGVGCAANIPGGCDPPIPTSGKFDSEGISYAWAPGTGVDPPAANGFMIARLTLSKDACGTFSYFGSTADGGTLLKEGLPICIPEPATAVLAAVIVLACCARRARIACPPRSC